MRGGGGEVMCTYKFMGMLHQNEISIPFCSEMICSKILIAIFVLQTDSNGISPVFCHVKPKFSLFTFCF
jgi:hypothetical protein